MSEIAVRDTTFDDITPKHLWITISNCNSTREIVVCFELNGLTKELFRMKPSYIDDGNICESHNLSWVFKKAKE